VLKWDAMDEPQNRFAALLSRAWKAIVVAFTTTRKPGASQDYDAGDSTMLGGLGEQPRNSRVRAPGKNDLWDASGESSYFADDNARKPDKR
jgi:hypothetical protein